MMVVPEKEGHTLELQWAIPAQQPLYATAPSNYVSHCLGCASPASLLPPRLPAPRHQGEGYVFPWCFIGHSPKQKIF